MVSGFMTYLSYHQKEYHQKEYYQLTLHFHNEGDAGVHLLHCHHNV